jgi:hypothetical protein
MNQSHEVGYFASPPMTVGRMSTKSGHPVLDGGNGGVGFSGKESKRHCRDNQRWK